MHDIVGGELEFRWWQKLGANAKHDKTEFNLNLNYLFHRFHSENFLMIL